MPDPPDQLDEEGVWFWCEIGPLLVQSGYLQEIDFPYFEQACEVYELAREAHSMVKEEGQVLKDPSHGGKKRHPAMLNYKQMADKFGKMCSKMGMNVNARMSIKIEDDDQRKSQMERLLEEGEA